MCSKHIVIVIRYEYVPGKKYECNLGYQPSANKRPSIIRTRFDHNINLYSNVKEDNRRLLEKRTLVAALTSSDEGRSDEGCSDDGDGGGGDEGHSDESDAGETYMYASWE